MIASAAPAGKAPDSAFAHIFADRSGGDVRDLALLSGGSSRAVWAFDVNGGSRSGGFVMHSETGLGPFYGTRFSLAREAETLRTLHASGLPVPMAYAVSGEGDALVSDRLPGRADFAFTDPASRLRTIDDFARQLAALHARDAGALGLPWMAAHSRAEATRADLEDHEWAYREIGFRNAVVEAAFAWLHAALPADDAAPSILQGDAGPTNFVHAEGAMTGFIDWEMAHAGDPHDDLAWIWFRVSMLGLDTDIRPWFEAYRAHSGRAIDVARLDYFIVAVMLRCTIANIVRRHNEGSAPTARIEKTADWLARALARARGESDDLPPRGLDSEELG